ncbi:MAG: hypothetical protein D6681_06440 [Calditrichaeota bacterium]|nr:MAG: hypothetical protein D6681_06440 [Calditrichota bacterium]
MHSTRVVKCQQTTGGLGQEIVLTVEGLTALLQRSRQQQLPIIPYLDGLPLPDVTVHPLDQNTVKFLLRRTEASRQNWQTIYRKRDSGFFTRKVSISIGLKDDIPVPTLVRDFKLIVLQKGWFFFSLALILGLLAGIGLLATRTELLRDAGPKPPDGRRTYSLARTQMAFWFFLVISSYLLIWLATGDLGSITDSILALIGISAGTAVGAAVVDGTKTTTTVQQRRELQAEKEVLENALTAMKTQIAAASTPEQAVKLQEEVAQKEIRLKKVEQQLQAIPTVRKGRASQGFLNDLLSDAQGISFHRFQMFAWTVVLGVIFVAEVYNNLQMPDFSGTLLGLMGISSGTYFGFKFPEQ